MISIKPLEWREEDEDGWWSALPMTGLPYEVRRTDRGNVRVRMPDNGEWCPFDGTVAEAKAAAQADYEKRILSALAHPYPLPLKEEVERVLEKMAEGWANVLELDLIPRQHRMSASILRDDARALLSRIRAGAREGWRHECATDGCSKRATVHFERGGVGSYYCHDCYMRVQALAPSPEAQEGWRS